MNEKEFIKYVDEVIVSSLKNHTFPTYEEMADVVLSNHNIFHDVLNVELEENEIRRFSSGKIKASGRVIQNVSNPVDGKRGLINSVHMEVFVDDPEDLDRQVKEFANNFAKRKKLFDKNYKLKKAVPDAYAFEFGVALDTNYIFFIDEEQEAEIIFSIEMEFGRNMVPVREYLITYLSKNYKNMIKDENDCEDDKELVIISCELYELEKKKYELERQIDRLKNQLKKFEE